VTHGILHPQRSLRTRLPVQMAPTLSPPRSYMWGTGIDIKRTQSLRRSHKATAIIKPTRRVGARSRIRRRNGNCHLPAVTVYTYPS